MKNKLLRACMVAAAISTVMQVPAYAENKRVASVNVTIREEKSEPGVVYPVEVTSNSSNYEMTSIELSKDESDWRPGRKVTYTIVLEPAEDYFFSKSDTKINITNGTLTSNYSIKPSKIEMKVNYVPKITLENPENIYFEDEYLATWDDVEYASAYEVKIYKDGSSHKTVKVTKNEIDLSDYATDYEDITFDVRAVAKNSDESKYIKASEWVNCDESVSASDNTSYGYFTGDYDSYKFKASNGEYASGWQQINGNWYYFNVDNGNKAIQSSWANINGLWYLFNEYCIMQIGWVKNNDVWYYLNLDGSMATGWMCSGPNGPWYYLDPGTGAMWHDTTTPDGYYVDSSGAWYK